MPNMITSEKYLRLSGNAEFAGGVLCTAIGAVSMALTASIEVAKSAIINVQTNQPEWVPHLDAQAPALVVGSLLVATAGVFLSRAGLEHVYQADQMRAPVDQITE
jgi:hypothetical protein